MQTTSMTPTTPTTEGSPDAVPQQTPEGGRAQTSRDASATGTPQARTQGTKAAAPTTNAGAAQTQTADSVDDTPAAPAATDPAPPSPTVAVPAPAGTDVSDTVPVRAQATLPSASQSEPVKVDRKITATLVGLEPSEAEAHLPGEIGGPALRVKITLSNESSRTVDLDGVTVTAANGKSQPLVPMFGGSATPFSGSLTAGQSVEGAYIFSLPEGTPHPFTITVNYTAEAPVAVFVGDIS